MVSNCPRTRGASLRVNNITWNASHATPPRESGGRGRSKRRCRIEHMGARKGGAGTEDGSRFRGFALGRRCQGNPGELGPQTIWLEAPTVAMVEAWHAKDVPSCPDSTVDHSPDYTIRRSFSSRASATATVITTTITPSPQNSVLPIYASNRSPSERSDAAVPTAHCW